MLREVSLCIGGARAGQGTEVHSRGPWERELSAESGHGGGEVRDQLPRGRESSEGGRRFVSAQGCWGFPPVHVRRVAAWQGSVAMRGPGAVGRVGG